MIEIPRPPSAATIDEYTSRGYWRDRTFADILRVSAEATPEREALPGTGPSPRQPST